MSAAPRVSVVIPAWNAAGFITETIRTVMASRDIACEVIVVDDGSSDDTARVVSGLGAPVRLVTGSRQGVCAARNLGVSLARADYIAFLDHDDLFEPDKLARQAAQLDSRPELGLVFTQARTVGGEAEELFPQIADPEPFLASAYENLVHWNYIPMSSVMARRSCLRATTGVRGEGPFDPRFALAEDWDLWLRLAADHAVGFIPEPLVRYVIRLGRATERMADLRLEDIAIVRAQIAAHPWLVTAAPGRCRATLFRLHEEAAWWLLKEGRPAEARKVLREAIRMRPSAMKPLAYYAASFLGSAGARS
jgi:glycosyltransferase involved in cell wall biosynthesis